jgi:hypothetical protein
VPVVLGLVRRIDADLGLEGDRLAVVAACAHRDRAARPKWVGVELRGVDLEGLAARRSEPRPRTGGCGTVPSPRKTLAGRCRPG